MKGPKQFPVTNFQFPVKKVDFWGLIGGKRGAGFGKCTKSVPFLDRFGVFYQDFRFLITDCTVTLIL
jgi:hypothetical protein